MRDRGAGVGLLLLACRRLVTVVLLARLGIKKPHRLETLQKSAGQGDGAIAHETSIHDTSVASLLHPRCDVSTKPDL